MILKFIVVQLNFCDKYVPFIKNRKMGEETAPAAVAGEAGGAGDAGGAGGAGGGGEGGVDLADYRLKVGNVLGMKFA